MVAPVIRTRPAPPAKGLPGYPSITAAARVAVHWAVEDAVPLVPWKAELPFGSIMV